MKRNEKKRIKKGREGIRRKQLKEDGNVHLPPHKVHPSKKDYKRLRKQDIELEDEL